MIFLKKITSGFGIGIGIGIGILAIFGVYVLVQAVVPGTIKNPTFSPATDDVTLNLSTCEWKLARPADAAHDNRPYLTYDDIMVNGATGICRCNDAGSTDIATILLEPNSGPHNNRGGYLETDSKDLWYCDDDSDLSCGGLTRTFAYLACG